MTTDDEPMGGVRDASWHDRPARNYTPCYHAIVINADGNERPACGQVMFFDDGTKLPLRELRDYMMCRRRACRMRWEDALATEVEKDLDERITKMGAERKGTYVEAKCISCKKKRRIYAGDVEPGDHPMCEDCFMPMVAGRASSG